MRFIVVCTVLFAGLAGTVVTGEEPRDSAPGEYLCVNLTPPRVCLIAVDGTISVVADIPSTRLSSIGMDGRAFNFNRLHVGELEMCQLAPGKISRDGDLETLCTFDRLKFFAAREVMPSPRGGGLAILGNPQAFDPDREPSQAANIYLLEPDRRRATALTRFQSQVGGGAEVLKWSPDGNLIAFYYAASSSAPDPNDVRLALCVVTRDGESRRLADETHMKAYSGHGADPYPGPVWSADSKTIFFIGHQESEDAGTPAGYPITYAVSANGGEIRRIGLGNPSSVTPDGRYLYCSAGSPRVKDLPCVRRRVDLTTGEYQDLGPEWRNALVSPSGQYVACFLAGPVVIFTVEGRELARIDTENHGLTKPGGVYSASWVSFK